MNVRLKILIDISKENNKNKPNKNYGKPKDKIFGFHFLINRHIDW